MDKATKTGCRVIVEASPIASNGDDGVVENAARAVEGQIRVTKCSVGWGGQWARGRTLCGDRHGGVCGLPHRPV